MTATSYSCLDKPMARIATGWRIGYFQYFPAIRRFYLYRAMPDGRQTGIHEAGTADEAKAEYMRLTQVQS